jgi:urea transport system permease protein
MSAWMVTFSASVLCCYTLLGGVTAQAAEDPIMAAAMATSVEQIPTISASPPVATSAVAQFVQGDFDTRSQLLQTWPDSPESLQQMVAAIEADQLYTGTEHFWWAMVLVFTVPALIAFVFGYFAFRSKIKGVYFSIITQAMTFAATLLFFRNETCFGGNNGFTGFKTILGYDITSAETRVALCFLTALILLLSFIGLRYLLSLPFGRVLGAIRDSENRLQYLGYRTLWYKLSAWTLSAVLAGIAGALYVPQVGIINPSEMSTVNSIEMAVWVAMGGRGTLIGALVGAGVVNAAKSYFTVAFPEIWLLILGALFIVVTLLLPNGLVGFFKQLKQKQAVKTPALPPALPTPEEASK